MSTSLESLTRQIHSAEDLAGVVRTMKTLAAVSIRQYEESADSLRHYRRTVEDGLRMVLHDGPGTEQHNRSRPRSSSGELAVVFGSDQGMCGQFNQQMMAFISDQFAEHRPVIVAVGQRMASLIEESVGTPAATLSATGSSAAMNDLVQDLLVTIDHLRKEHRIEHVAVYFSQRRSATLTEPHRSAVLPLDLRRYTGRWDEHRQSNSLPLHTLARERLLSVLVREHLFVSLYRACAESLASENAARIRSMQTAERNIEERLRELRSEFNQQRQTTVTEELLDVVSGFEVLQSDRMASHSNS